MAALVLVAAHELPGAPEPPPLDHEPRALAVGWAGGKVIGHGLLLLGVAHGGGLTEVALHVLRVGQVGVHEQVGLQRKRAQTRDLPFAAFHIRVHADVSCDDQRDRLLHDLAPQRRVLKLCAGGRLAGRVRLDAELLREALAGFRERRRVRQLCRGH